MSRETGWWLNTVGPDSVPEEILDEGGNVIDVIWTDWEGKGV